MGNLYCADVVYTNVETLISQLTLPHGNQEKDDQFRTQATSYHDQESNS